MYSGPWGDHWKAQKQMFHFFLYALLLYISWRLPVYLKRLLHWDRQLAEFGLLTKTPLGIPTVSISENMGLSSSSTPLNRFLLMHTLGSRRWRQWLRFLNSCHPHGRLTHLDWVLSSSSYLQALAWTNSSCAGTWRHEQEDRLCISLFSSQVNILDNELLTMIFVRNKQDLTHRVFIIRLQGYLKDLTSFWSRLRPEMVRTNLCVFLFSIPLISLRTW